MSFIYLMEPKFSHSRRINCDTLTQEFEGFSKKRTSHEFIRTKKLLSSTYIFYFSCFFLIFCQVYIRFCRAARRASRGLLYCFEAAGKIIFHGLCRLGYGSLFAYSHVAEEAQWQISISHWAIICERHMKTFSI